MRSSSGAYFGHQPGEYQNNGELNSGSAWVTASDQIGRWYQLDNGADAQIWGVVTQGRSDDIQWVTSYKVEAKSETGDWFWVDNEKIFSGNTDRSTLVENLFSTPVTARYFKIYPQTWHSYMAMRADLLVVDV